MPTQTRATEVAYWHLFSDLLILTANVGYEG